MCSMEAEVGKRLFRSCLSVRYVCTYLYPYIYVASVSKYVCMSVWNVFMCVCIRCLCIYVCVYTLPVYLCVCVYVACVFMCVCIRCLCIYVCVCVYVACVLMPVTRQTDWRAGQPSQVACVWKCWGTSCRHTAKDIAPPIATRVRGEA